MAEEFLIPAKASRSEVYEALFPQVQALVHDEQDEVAAMANFAAALMQAFKWHWIGFYRVRGEQLVLGPFQGPIACTPIAKGSGVCGRAWAEQRVFVVPDVDAFPGHIACSNQSRSELVIPLRAKDGTVKAVFDVDSTHLNDFGPQDVEGLGRLCGLLEHLW